MTLFEFITVMVSMILALSLGHLLEGISYLIRVRGRVRWNLPYVLWLGTLVPSLVNHWWSLWDLRELTWNYASFLYILIAPIMLSFAASFLAVDRPERGPIDLSAHFSRISSPFLMAMFVHVLAMWFDGPMFAGQRVFGFIGLLHIPMLGGYALALLSKRRLAEILAPCITLGMLVTIMVIRLSALAG